MAKHSFLFHAASGEFKKFQELAGPGQATRVLDGLVKFYNDNHGQLRLTAGGSEGESFRLNSISPDVIDRLQGIVGEDHVMRVLEALITHFVKNPNSYKFTQTNGDFWGQLSFEYVSNQEKLDSLRT